MTTPQLEPPAICDRDSPTGAVRLRTSSLPGRTACATTFSNGVLWIFIDPSKPAAAEHARAMMREAEFDGLVLDSMLGDQQVI